MPGDRPVGVALRELRVARRLTLAAVAHRVGCATSLISQVESGRRSLQPWLASALDEVYGAGGSVSALGSRRHPSVEVGAGQDESMVVIRVPGEDGSTVISRREALLVLGLGVLSEPFATVAGRRAWGLTETHDVMVALEARLTGQVRLARSLPAARIAPGLLADVVVLERVRQSCPPALCAQVSALQARFAESLSWLGEEAGDPGDALFWMDRCAVWSQAAGWPAMIAYTFVRRSMMALTFSDDVVAAVRHADLAMRVPGVPPSVQALAAKQAAYGYALAGRPDDSARALDAVAPLSGAACGDDDAWRVVGQRSVLTDDLHAIFDGTCRVYLGRGAAAAELLQPRMERIASGSARTSAITAAKLARAAVDAGDVAAACERVRSALEQAQAVGSASAKAELRRAERGLARWPGHRDVAETRQLLVEAGVTKRLT